MLTFLYKSLWSSATRKTQVHYSLFFLPTSSSCFHNPLIRFCAQIQLCNMAGFNKINGAILILLLAMAMSQPALARLLGGSLLHNVDTSSGGNDVSEGEEVNRYRPLLLNLLPKGPLPPSGPSKRTNNVVN